MGRRTSAGEPVPASCRSGGWPRQPIAPALGLDQTGHGIGLTLEMEGLLFNQPIGVTLPVGQLWTAPGSGGSRGHKTATPQPVAGGLLDENPWLGFGVGGGEEI